MTEPIDSDKKPHIYGKYLTGWCQSGHHRMCNSPVETPSGIYHCTCEHHQGPPPAKGVRTVSASRGNRTPNQEI